jgi:hypothetical protein
VSRLRGFAVNIAAAIFAVALVRHFYGLGPPYFAIPETIQDHVFVGPSKSRDAIVMTRRAALLIPRGATVTVLGDPTLRYIATGLMPHHTVVAGNAQFVITIGDPFDDPAYTVHSEFAEGRIYRRR